MSSNGSETLSSAQANRAPALENYDLVILGGGTGSTVAAWTFAAQGQRVAVIERKYIGGSCPNIACLPSKNILHSARVASYFRRGEEFGMFSNGFRVDMPAVLGGLCCRGWRDHGFGTGCHDGPIALYRTPRCHLGPPNSRRRAEPVVLVCAFAIGACRWASRGSFSVRRRSMNGATK
jgi:hypothetical protein